MQLVIEAVDESGPTLSRSCLSRAPWILLIVLPKENFGLDDKEVVAA
jgi:hypothetical protein